MRINGGNFGPVRPDAAREVRGPSTEEASNRNTNPATPERTDSVEISDAGRAKAAGLEAPGAGSERLEQIRARVLSGAYNSLEVVDEVARRIVERGDIGSDRL
jgi:hypothetical protein